MVLLEDKKGHVLGKCGQGLGRWNLVAIPWREAFGGEPGVFSSGCRLTAHFPVTLIKTRKTDLATGFTSELELVV